MKNNNWKTLSTIAGATLLCAMTWLVVASESAASVAVKGQDVAGKKCERLDYSGSTFGRCEIVCNDREVVRDSRKNRWVCRGEGKVIRIRR